MDDAGLPVRFLFGDNNRFSSPPIFAVLELALRLLIVVTSSLLYFSDNAHPKSEFEGGFEHRGFSLHALPKIRDAAPVADLIE